MNTPELSSAKCETENTMQKLLYIARLLEMFLIITLCVSCSHEQSSSSYVRERVEDLKRQTAPSDASVTRNRRNRAEGTVRFCPMGI